MKIGRFITQRVLNGLIAFILIMAMISTIYDIHYEQTIIERLNDTFKGMIGNMILEGEFEGKSAEETKKMRAEVRLQVLTMFNLHRPRWERIAKRTYKAVTFDWGEVHRGGKFGHYVPVRVVIFEALPNTLILFGTTTVISILLAIYLGVKKAQYANSFFDRITSLMTMFFIGVPPWVTASFLILFFVYFLEILPFGAFYSTNPPPVGLINIVIDRLKHMIIPLMAVILVRIWGPSYQIKNILLGHLQEDYVTASRGRGLPERKVLFGHALRTASPAIITMALLSMLQAVSGDIILEKVLAWPGIGLMLWKAIRTNNMDIIMGITTLMTLFFVTTMIILDLIYVLLDPRITYK